VLEALDGIIKNVEAALATDTSTTETMNPRNVSQPAKGADGDVNGTSCPKGEKKQKKKKEKKPKAPQPPPVAPEVSQFLQCDLRVGRVTVVDSHPEADGLFVLQVDYGNGETKTVCAGLRKFISEEEMKARKVVTICNLKPRKLRGVASEAMILAGSVVSGDGDKETVVPIAPPPGAEEGAIVRVQGLEGERTVSEGKFVSGKVWDKVVPRLGVKEEQACYNGSPLVVGSAVVSCTLPDGAEIH